MQENKLLTGFTIIELVISIFILSVAVVGIFSAFSIMVISTSDTTDRLTAAYLAQEGMEIVRNIRDNNWLTIIQSCVDPNTECSFDEWAKNYLDSCSKNSVGCQADYRATSLSSYAVGSNVGYLYLENGFYVYNPISTSPKQTKFKRKIIIDKEGSENQILRVRVQVSWKQKASLLGAGVADGECKSSNCITTEETLYNWF